MFDFGGFTNGVISLIRTLVQLYFWIVLIRVLVSWINPDPYNPIIQFLRGITDPAIDALRRVLPRFFWQNRSGLDFTPLFLILLLQLVILFLNSIHL